jgi:hypothetical protein
MLSYLEEAESFHFKLGIFLAADKSVHFFTLSILSLFH